MRSLRWPRLAPPLAPVFAPRFARVLGRVFARAPAPLLARVLAPATVLWLLAPGGPLGAIDAAGGFGPRRSVLWSALRDGAGLRPSATDIGDSSLAAPLPGPSAGPAAADDGHDGEADEWDVLDDRADAAPTTADDDEERP